MSDKSAPARVYGHRLKNKLSALYFGNDRSARIFRWSLLAFDFITIVYFLVASFYHSIDSLHVVEEAIGSNVAALVQWREVLTPKTMVQKTFLQITHSEERIPKHA